MAKRLLQGSYGADAGGRMMRQVIQHDDVMLQLTPTLCVTPALTHQSRHRCDVT